MNINNINNIYSHSNSVSNNIQQKQNLKVKKKKVINGSKTGK